MIRDFTEGAENELNRLVNRINVNDAGLYSAAGEWSMGGVDVSGYVAKVKKYNQSILDQNHKTKTDIGRVFKEVDHVDTRYKNTLGNHAALLKESLDYLKSLAQTLDPSISIMSPSFSLTSIANNMKAAFEKYSQGLVDYYLNMLRTEKVDRYGNTYYEYDFDYIRKIM